MDVVIRAAIVFIFLFVLVRVIGRRELSSLEPFDIILLVVIGDYTQQAVTQQDNSVTGAILAIGTIALLAVGISWLTYRLPRLRPVVEGRPIVLIENGQVIAQNLERERITLDEVAAQARLQQIEHLEQIRWAVLETSGSISFIPRGSTPLQ